MFIRKDISKKGPCKLPRKQHLKGLNGTNKAITEEERSNNNKDMSSSTTASAAHIVKQLEPMRGKRVSVVLTDGRHLLATLASYDNLSNVMLGNVSEYFYSCDGGSGEGVTDNGGEDEGAQQRQKVRSHEVDSLQPMMVRGTMIAAIGLVDTLAEATGES